MPSLICAVEDFETKTWDARECRRNGRLTARRRFRENFRAFVEKEWERFAATAPDESCARPLAIPGWLRNALLGTS